ncbi:MAG: hypothetical protein MUF04_03950 [Akkermansiaceae bacterium]|nr:hypothetical protein [Akkermansiaceae bacterium]
MKEHTIPPRPAVAALAGPLPRPLLLLTMEDRGERVFDDPSETSFRVFDPAEPERGVRRIFVGPGNYQRLALHTPLFGGWGIASGRLDPEKEPEQDGGLFWFNLLDGTKGPRIGDSGSSERLDESGMAFLGDGNRVCHLDPLGGTLRVIDLEMADVRWLSPTRLLGRARIKGEPRLVQLDTGRASCEVIGALPAGFEEGLELAGDGVFAAGRHGAEGYYAVRDFTLWYLPPGEPWKVAEAEDWRLVIDKVPVVKTFGGVMPWLPVRYMGRGRFAVARTIRDDIPVPPFVPEDERMFGAAEAVTMLLDGRTGKVLKTTAPYYYNHNPPLRIGEAWWSDALRPKPPEEKPPPPSPFRWNKERTEVRFGADGEETLGEDDASTLSHDGRFLAIYPRWSRMDDGETKLTVRIIDGQSGSVQRLEIASEFYEVLAGACWEMLCPEDPGREVLRTYGRETMDWFMSRFSD